MGSYKGHAALWPHTHIASGPTGVRRPGTGNPVPDVEAVDGFHGHVAQERRGGETAVQVHIAHDRGRFHHVPDRVPGRGPVRSGRVHARDIVAQVGRKRPPQPSPAPAPARQRQRHPRRKTPAHPLLQILDKQFETKLILHIIDNTFYNINNISSFLYNSI